jgi:hypothetical protein
MTPMALRPGGVPNATIVSITAHPVIIRRKQKSAQLRVAFLKPNPKPTLWAFPYGFRLQVFAFGQGNMNHSPFLRIHRSKSEDRSSCSNLGGSVRRHRTQFGLPGGAEPVNIADDPLARGQTSPKCLVNKMLQSFKEFSALSLEQFRIPAIQIEQAPVFSRLCRHFERESSFR